MSSLKTFPWYFYSNRVDIAWKYSRGEGIVVDLVDSCVDFTLGALRNKNYSHAHQCNFSEFKAKAAKLHGTAMAGLICANRVVLVEQGTGEKIAVAGVAPQ